MRSSIILFLFLLSAAMQGQANQKPFQTYEPSLDSASTVLVWQNLRIMAMDSTKSGLPKDYKTRISGEFAVTRVIASLSMITEKDLQQLQQKLGDKNSWEIYFDFDDKFKQNYKSRTYYVWLKPAR
jgi:hypothetical protein